MTLSKADFLDRAGALPFVDVAVPDLGEGATVRIRVMSGVERDEWDASLRERKDLRGFRATLVRLCLIEETTNQLMFSAADQKAVERLNGNVLDAIFNAASELNKLGAKAEGEAEKNSQSGMSDGSGTTSPAQ